MSLGKSTQVLVVGAGPVGMTTALLLANEGARCVIVDEDSGPAARSYACALHPHSLELFDWLGLIDEILPLGRRIDSVVFHEGSARRAEVKLSQLSSKHPFLLVLPQNELEALLQRELKRKTGVSIHWNHRLADLKANGGGVVATVNQLAETATGYIVPHWELTVKKTRTITSNFLIGADGHNSIVRQRLGIDPRLMNGPQLFAVFEFDTDAKIIDEVHIALDEDTTNVLWPLTEGRYRWGFQSNRKNPRDDFPHKERRAFWIDDPDRNWELEQRLLGLIKERAPWFTPDVKRFDWICHVQFEHSVVNRYGRWPCWLVGDAAHQTGPAGVQSLNAGLREAAELAAVLRDCSAHNVLVSAMQKWETRQLAEWERLLGFNGSPRASAAADPWVKKHAAQILSCLPATGDHLTQLAAQLHLELP